MIRKETIKKTRDFLNAVKGELATINKGFLTVSEMADIYEVSDGRMVAAVDLGYFKPVGRRGRGFIYKCTVPYFNGDIAAAVIRREYNMREATDRGGKKPSVPKKIREYSLEVEVLDAISTLQDNGYKGMLYRSNVALEAMERIVL